MATKGQQIRDLHTQGLTAPQIVQRGFARATVYQTIGRQRKKTPDRVLLEDLLSVNLELLRLVRRLAGEKSALDD